MQPVLTHVGDFKVVRSVTWPVNAGKACCDHALIQTSLLFSFECDLVSFHLE